eukprot:scaffold11676_cov130-Isochrysis_galbana.AAC.1
MAPLQLRLEPTEVVLATDKGAARARVPRRHHRRELTTDMIYDFAPARRPVARPEPAQRTAGVLPVYLPELRLLAWVVSAAKTTLGVAAPPHYYHSKKLSTTTPSGITNHHLHPSTDCARNFRSIPTPCPCLDGP